MRGDERILAILFGLIGDTMMRLPSLRALRERHPGIHLTGLCDPVTAPVLEVNQLFDEVLVWNRRSTPWMEEARRWLTLRRSRFDVALDFYFGSRTPWIAWASGARRRIGPARSAVARRLLTDVLPFPMPAQQHMIDRFAEFVRPLGVVEVRHEWEFPLHEQVRERTRRALAPLGAPVCEDDLVVVAGAGDVSKRLDEAILAETISRLGPRRGRRVLLVCDQRDPSADTLLRSGDGVVALPPLPLDELGAVFADCGLLLVPDTGPLHVGLATAPRVLTWYLSTDPLVHHARRVGHRYLYCKVCPMQPCDTRMKHLCALECRSSIRADELVTAAEELWTLPGWAPPAWPARDSREFRREMSIRR